jgi:hypothetical protein
LLVVVVVRGGLETVALGAAVQVVIGLIRIFL